jgi:hypothetical protein
MIRAKRLRAMRRLLDYAVVEGRELQLPNFEQLLGAAALEVDDALAAAETSRGARGSAHIKLVADVGNARRKATGPSPDLGHPASAR